MFSEFAFKKNNDQTKKHWVSTPSPPLQMRDPAPQPLIYTFHSIPFVRTEQGESLGRFVPSKGKKEKFLFAPPVRLSPWQNY